MYCGAARQTRLHRHDRRAGGGVWRIPELVVGKPNVGAPPGGLGKDWEAVNVGYKPHASVTSIHTALDALADLMRENKLKPDDIADVDAGVSHMTYVQCAWEYKAQGVTAAQMNLIYGLAVIASRHGFRRAYTEDRSRDPKIFDFITRISARVDPEIEGMGAAFRHAARMTLTTSDGRTFTAKSGTAAAARRIPSAGTRLRKSLWPTWTGSWRQAPRSSCNCLLPSSRFWLMPRRSSPSCDRSPR